MCHILFKVHFPPCWLVSKDIISMAVLRGETAELLEWKDIVSKMNSSSKAPIGFDEVPGQGHITTHWSCQVSIDERWKHSPLFKHLILRFLRLLSPSRLLSSEKKKSLNFDSVNDLIITIERFASVLVFSETLLAEYIKYLHLPNTPTDSEVTPVHASNPRGNWHVSALPFFEHVCLRSHAPLQSCGCYLMNSWWCLEECFPLKSLSCRL